MYDNVPDNRIDATSATVLCGIHATIEVVLSGRDRLSNIYAGAVAIVTGGGSGIGRALATLLAGRGARVAVADISLEDARATADAIGASAKAYRCDVTDLASMEAMAEQVKQDIGRVNFVFANAGVLVQAGLLETDPAEFEWLFDVNVRGVFHTLRAFSGQLLDAASGGEPARLVITGSENSVGLPFLGIMSAYTATKHALLGLADAARRDLEETGVKVSILCPGGVNTRLWDAKRVRQDRYGGSSPILGQEAEANEQGFATLVSAEKTAGICLDAAANDEFLIISDPNIRAIADRRHEEVDAAFDRLDARISAAS